MFVRPPRLHEMICILQSVTMFFFCFCLFFFTYSGLVWNFCFSCQTRPCYLTLPPLFIYIPGQVSPRSNTSPPFFLTSFPLLFLTHDFLVKCFPGFLSLGFAVKYFPAISAFLVKYSPGFSLLFFFVKYSCFLCFPCQTFPFFRFFLCVFLVKYLIVFRFFPYQTFEFLPRYFFMGIIKYF